LSDEQRRSSARPVFSHHHNFRRANDAGRGDLFCGLRRLLALSQTLALAYPIKKWAALFAIAGAVFYDLATGSRVGTERALFMTVIMLASSCSTGRR